jgi:diguanylate cyclase (GGDEF)-like protein
MSQETTTQLLGLPTEYGVPGEDGKAFSAAEVDQCSASRMLRLLMLFAWALPGAVLVLAFLGYGTDFSNLLAGGWFAVLSILLLAWPRMNLFWHRDIAVVILMLIVIRWSVSWLYAEPADAMIGLLCTPVLIITTLLWGRLSVYVGAGTGLVMGLFSYMGIWVRDGDQLRETAESVAERALNLFATGQRRYAVMMIDIDHFKAINDQHGHDTGDRILQRIAEILRARMRLQDTVARWGGEEFMVIVEGVTRYESASIAESLRHMIEAGTGEILKTKISIGVAHSETGRSVDQILKRADEGYTRQKTRAVIQW